MKFTAGHAKVAANRLINETEDLVDEGPDTIPGGQYDRTIGDILKASEQLDDEQIADILQFQQQRGGAFGEAAVALHYLSRDEVLWALSQQFQYPYAATPPSLDYKELVAAVDPFGAQAEAFRELRSQLLMGVLASHEPRRALAVVSPDRGDGKTFVAANLAVAFSQLGEHTLLIDLDMRTPRQHEMFNLGAGGGVSNILSGRSEANVIRPVKDLPSLFVLPVGVVPPNPLELVQRPAFGMLVRELLTRFDYVVVDTPARSHGADARVIAARCGAAVAVGRQGSTRMADMHRLMASLAKGPAKLAGIVMNDH